MEKMRSIRPDEIEIRMKGAGKYSEKVTWLLYKTARVDAAILTEAFGLFGWQNKYYRVGNSLVCAIGIYDVDKGEWVWKSDIGDETTMEAVKGEASDAFKRAGFKWGIGIQLYNAPKISLDPSYKFVDIDCIELDDNRITKLVLKSNGEIVFDWDKDHGNKLYKKSASTKPAEKSKDDSAEHAKLLSEAKELEMDMKKVHEWVELESKGKVKAADEIPSFWLKKAIERKKAVLAVTNATQKRG